MVIRTQKCLQAKTKEAEFKFQKLTMSCLNCGFILILISILMTRISLTNGRSYEEKYRNGLQFDDYKYRRPYSSLRHNHHYYSRKHKHHNFYYDSSHFRKKPRRFTALDKVDDRLDNAAVYFSEKNLKLTTSSPVDIWEDNTTPNASFFTNVYMSNFITYKDDNDKTTTNHIDRKHKHERERNHGWDKGLYDDYETDLIGDGKGYLQDFTTSKPPESVRQDTTYNDRLNATVGSTSTTESVSDKITDPAWTGRQSTLGSLDDSMKKTTRKTVDPRDALFKHLLHVLQEGRCHTPKAKIIHVHEVHPHPSKLYSPPCTILHRCGADTGCCESLKDVCKPKNITKVELYFSTTFMGQRPKVEKLHFENHTECECRSRAEDLMLRDEEDEKYLGKNKIGAGRGTSTWKSDNCTCPSNFSPHYRHGGASCICDCFDKHNDCIALKKGKVIFPLKDRLCMKNRICSFPSCKFGLYIPNFGRCPKKGEKHRMFVPRSRIT